jgi:hypothetical protein
MDCIDKENDYHALMVFCSELTIIHFGDIYRT